MSIRIFGSGGGGVITDATATPADVISGRVFYNNNGKQTGTYVPSMKTFIVDYYNYSSDHKLYFSDEAALKAPPLNFTTDTSVNGKKYLLKSNGDVVNTDQIIYVPLSFNKIQNSSSGLYEMWINGRDYYAGSIDTRNGKDNILEINNDGMNIGAVRFNHTGSTNYGYAENTRMPIFAYSFKNEPGALYLAVFGIVDIGNSSNANIHGHYIFKVGYASVFSKLSLNVLYV